MLCCARLYTRLIVLWVLLPQGKLESRLTGTDTLQATSAGDGKQWNSRHLLWEKEAVASILWIGGNFFILTQKLYFKADPVEMRFCFIFSLALSCSRSLAVSFPPFLFLLQLEEFCLPILFRKNIDYCFAFISVMFGGVRKKWNNFLS